MRAQALTRPRLPVPRRLLAALSDERLAGEVIRGNAAAFEVIYDRHHRGLLSFCRHLLRSQEDGEDALQQTFASAFRALPKTNEPVQLKPWLYTIARNRCLSMLRARREHASEEIEIVSGSGLSDEVEKREDLRALLSDLEALPEEQRSALVLSEVADLKHDEISEALGCERKKVKALVFQARSALLEDRRARDMPCAEIREQLASASAGELRRGYLRRHVRTCAGCAEFREEIRHQRGMLALALPVVPSLGLKESALAAAGVGGGGAAGGGGLLAALGAHGAAKVATVAIVTGGTAGGVAATDPGLVDKAQAAVAGAVTEVQSVVAGSSAGDDGEDSPERDAGGSFDWESAERTARKKTREGRKAGRGAFASGERPPAKGPGKSRGQSAGRGRPRGGDARGQQRGAADAKAPGQSKRGASSPGRAHGATPRGGSGIGRPSGAGGPRLNNGGGPRLNNGGGVDSGKLPKPDRIIDRGRGLGGKVPPR